MSSEPVTVSAQWAWQGKTPDREGYRILACSSGSLSGRNFDEALSRFSPGMLDDLPQVSVSYLRPAGQDDGGYLALAIHDGAADGDSQRARMDDTGREITHTSYFCVPFAPLASEAIGYQAMHQAFAAVRLPATHGPPIRVTVTASTALTPAVDDLAMRTAALLLTGSPVCVLGAEASTVAERLAFIDTVMALLPYGLRSRMAAATWTRATHREHHFRLFFSGAPRVTDRPDHIVTWGNPGRPVITTEYGAAAHRYYSWLADKVRQPTAQLAGLTSPIGFGNSQASRLLELVGITGASRFPGAAAAERRHPSAEPVSSSTWSADRGESALLGCAAAVAEGNATRLRGEISTLERCVHAGLDADHRPRYRELIAEHGLLKPQDKFGRWESRLYEPLLALAFGVPLSYEGYCQLEDCLGNPPGTPPHPALLQAIDQAGIADPVTKAIVCWHLRESDEGRLSEWFLSGDVAPEELVHLLARDSWDRTQHARIVCDVTLDFLKQARTRYEPGKLRAALRQHGFLAGTLQLRCPGGEQYQIHALYRFLQAAFPDGLDRRAVTQVLTGLPAPPTPALFAAVLMLLPRPGDWRRAWDAYVNGSITLISLDAESRQRLAGRFPSVHGGRGAEDGTE